MAEPDDLPAEAPQIAQEGTEPEGGTQDAVRQDLTALRDLAASLVKKKGYGAIEQIAILDMWVTSTIAEMGSMFYENPAEQEKFAYAVVASRMRADVEYLSSKPDHPSAGGLILAK